jgi:hypothetical protein
MGKDMTSNRLATISASKESTCAWITLHLVGQENGDVELWTMLVVSSSLFMRPTFGDMCQLRQELVELLLPLIQFTTASVVDSKKRHDAVNDEETVLVTNKELGDLVQELHLVLGVDRTSVSDVVLGCTVLVAINHTVGVYSLVSGSTPKRSAI